MLREALDKLCLNWDDRFKQNQKGNYTASLPIDTLEARCNIYRRGSDDWAIGIFTPLGIVDQYWGNGGYTPEEAITRAKDVFRSIMAKWIEEVAPM